MTISKLRAVPGAVVATLTLIGAAPAQATQYPVSDAAGLQSALGKVVAGDVIVLASGP